MPELPEVETVVRGLRRQVVGRRILSVRLGKTDFIEDPNALVERLPGSRVIQVERYGKFISLEFAPRQDESKNFYLLIHLGMTGQLGPWHSNHPVARHTHAFFTLDDGRELRYTDIRRFGRMLVVSAPEIGAFRRRLGLDPLEATEDEFRKRLAGRRARIKALLLDQQVLRGLGNIYADESLWRARIHPARHALRLAPRELARLYRAIREVLRAAIRLRGSSVSNYRDAEGRPGEYQQRHRVYRREGKPCFRCGRKIRRASVAGRSSYFCPRCQPPPQGRPPAGPQTRGVAEQGSARVVDHAH